MAYILKLSVYLVDPNECIDEMSMSEFNDRVNGSLRSFDMIPKYPQIKIKDIGEWSDDHPLNSINCGAACCESYFKETASEADILLKFAADLQQIRNKCKGNIEKADAETAALITSVRKELKLI